MTPVVRGLSSWLSSWLGPCLLALVACGAGPGDQDPDDCADADPGTAPRESSPALEPTPTADWAADWPVDVRDETCIGCHDEVADEWGHSRHRAAFTNPDFQASYRREPLDFCRDCHAPRRQLIGDAAAERLGVGCVSCHVREGLVFTGSGTDTDIGMDGAPHEVVRSASFGTDACADCHEFEFPEGRGRHPPGARMQLTMTEHAASPFAEVSCGDCHLPALEGGRRRHGMASTRSDVALRGALEVRARRVAGDLLELELDPRGVGHAFPTGDLFRRLAIEVVAVDDEGRRQGEALRYLARHFPSERLPDGALNPAALAPEPDDRLRGRTVLRLRVPAATAGDRLRWSVTYERVDARNARAPAESTVASAVPLAAGEL